MCIREVIYVLNNAAWLGSNDDRNKIEEAVRIAVKILSNTFEPDLISRQAVIDALRTCYDTETVTMDNGDEYINYGDAIGEIEQLPSAEPDIKPISYEDCANAMLMMWMDNVVTDGEYSRIMDKLNDHEKKRRSDERSDKP